MGIYAEIRFVMDSIARNKLRFFGEILMIFISLFMLTVGIFMKAQSKYYRTSLDDVLTKKVAGTGSLLIEEYDSEEDILAFFQEAQESTFIDAIGSAGEGITNILPQLAEIQQGHTEYGWEPGYVEMQYVTDSLLPLCNISLAEGELITEFDERGDHWCGLYLGWEFREIPVGTVFTYTVNGEPEEYEVLGILEKGTRWVDPYVTRGNFSGATRGYEDMDYSVLFLYYDSVLDMFGMFSVEDGVAMTDAVAYLNQLADKYNLRVTFGSMEKEMEKAETQNALMQKVTFQIFFLMSVTAIICILSFLMISIISRSGEYGILYAIGMGQSDLIRMNAIEIGLKFIIAFSSALAASYYFIQMFFSEGPYSVVIMKELLFRYVYGPVFLIGVLLFLTAAVGPMIYINRKSPVELLEVNHI